MTWKEFKNIIEEQGVTDETELDYIDWNGYNSNPEVIIHKEYGEVQIS